MPSRRTSHGRNTVGPERASVSSRQHLYTFEPFSSDPIAWDPDDSNGAPTGTTGERNLVFTGHNIFEYSILGAGQTIVRPVLATVRGYDWGMDQAATEGVEINFGSLKVNHPRVFKVGRDEFYARLLVSVEDISGLDLFFGFRGGAASPIEGVQTALATYTDLFGLRVLGDSSSAAGAVTTVTNLNDATDVTETATSTTVADATATEFKVEWRGDRVAMFVDGDEIYPRSAFVADTDDYFTPVAYLLHTTDVAGQVLTYAFECGLLADQPTGVLS